MAPAQPALAPEQGRTAGGGDPASRLDDRDQLDSEYSKLSDLSDSDSFALILSDSESLALIRPRQMEPRNSAPGGPVIPKFSRTSGLPGLLPAGPL